MSIALLVDEAAAVEQVRDTIAASENDIVAGIAFQGSAKRISTMATSVLSPFAGYLAVAVDCSNVRSRSAGQEAVRNPPRINHYQMTIVVVDAAYTEQGEDTAFSAAHNNFRLMSDRIVSLIELSYRGWVIHTDSGLKFQIMRARGNDRLVEKTNIIPRLSPTDDHIIELRCAISFALESRCQPS